MQNQNTSAVLAPKKYMVLLTVGILLLAFGLLFLREANLPATERSPLGHTFGAFIFASPLMLVMGAALLLMGAVRAIQKFTKVESIISPHQAARFRKAWRIFLWVATVLTIYPWWWLDLLARFNGERPGNEGEGMGGALITMFFGIPALALTIFNEVRILRKK